LSGWRRRLLCGWRPRLLRGWRLSEGGARTQHKREGHGTGETSHYAKSFPRKINHLPLLMRRDGLFESNGK
jgi:hypothetical protein